MVYFSERARITFPFQTRKSSLDDVLHPPVRMHAAEFGRGAWLLYFTVFFFFFFPDWDCLVIWTIICIFSTFMFTADYRL